jgi:hypothetical protein
MVFQHLVRVTGEKAWLPGAAVIIVTPPWSLRQHTQVASTQATGHLQPQRDLGGDLGQRRVFGTGTEQAASP